MNYHKVIENDCLSVASKKEKQRLSQILDIALYKELAKRWCAEKGYNLYGYLGNLSWDATAKEG